MSCVSGGGSIATNINNLVKDGCCSAGGVNFKTGDPLLGPLQDNGGSTPTFALLSNSPAIDAGDSAACAAAPVSGKDQRGQDRDDYQCDIGAFELKYADGPTVSKAIPGAGSYTFGPTLVKVAVTGPTCLTGVTIQRYNENHPNATTPLQTGHWWAITPSGCTSGFDVSLTLPTDFTPDAHGMDRLCRHVSGTTWDCAYSSLSPNSITRNNVTAFSDWAAGNEAGPTAVTLRSLTAHAASHPVSGPVFGGLLALAGASALKMSAILRLKRRAR